MILCSDGSYSGDFRRKESTRCEPSTKIFSTSQGDFCEKFPPQNALFLPIPKLFSLIFPAIQRTAYNGVVLHFTYTCSFLSSCAGLCHHNVKCSWCNEQPTGILWKCVQCYGYVLCSQCYGAGKHSMEHKFDRCDRLDQKMR